MPKIAPWSFVKIWTKNVTPQVLVHCAAIFQRICKCHTNSESWDQALSGIEAHFFKKSATNEKSAPEKWNFNMSYLLNYNPDQKSVFLKNNYVLKPEEWYFWSKFWQNFRGLFGALKSLFLVKPKALSGAPYGISRFWGQNQNLRAPVYGYHNLTHTVWTISHQGFI